MDALKLACLALALFLAVTGAGLWFLRQGNAVTRNEEVAEHMRDIQFDLSFGGAGAVILPDMPDAMGWLGGAEGNLIVLDAKGVVRGSANKNLLGGDALRLVVSPYHDNRRDSMGVYADAALALVLDGGGQILHRFLMIARDGEFPAFGRDDPAFREIFPSVNKAMVAACARYLQEGDVDFPGWEEELSENGLEDALKAFDGRIAREEWMEDGEVLQALKNGATQEDVDRVKQYCQWERDQLHQAGDWCARLVQADDGDLYALALYENSEAANAAYNAMMRRWDLFFILLPAWQIGILILILLMALWAFRDARRRDFKPAMWGILVLLGNVVALVVYLIVRPGGALCPACGAGVRRDFAVCPMCGHALRARCMSCGRAQEDAWVCCPYCGFRRAGVKESA
jgi:hypothetical protein